MIRAEASSKSKDGSLRNDGDSNSTTTSSGNVSNPANTHRSHGRDRDKTVVTASDVDPVPPIDIVRATRPVPDVTTPRSTGNLPAILHTDSRCADAALCPLSL